MVTFAVEERPQTGSFFLSFDFCLLWRSACRIIGSGNHRDWNHYRVWPWPIIIQVLECGPVEGSWNCQSRLQEKYAVGTCQTRLAFFSVWVSWGVPAATSYFFDCHMTRSFLSVMFGPDAENVKELGQTLAEFMIPALKLQSTDTKDSFHKCLL